MKYATYILLVLCLSFAFSAIAGQESVENGVVRVENSDVPSQGQEILELEELWRIGGEDEEFIFRAIDSVLLANDGNLYILDGSSNLIYVNSFSDGSAIREMSIDGEGPGELRHATKMFLMGEDKLALLRSYGAKLACIDYNGIPQQSYDVRGNSYFNAGFAGWKDDVLIIAGKENNTYNGQTYVSRFDEYGEMYRYESYPVQSSIEKRLVAEEDEYFISYKPGDVGQGGKLYFAPYWALADYGYYQINVYSPQGKKERIITRKYESYKRLDKDMQGLINQRFCGEDGLRQFNSTGIPYQFEEFDPDVLTIDVNPDGNIWVCTSRGVRNQDEGILLSYDVFSPQGDFVKQVSLAAQGDGSRDKVYFLDENTLAIVKGQTDVEFGCPPSPGTEDILEIICYGFRKR